MPVDQSYKQFVEWAKTCASPIIDAPVDDMSDMDAFKPIVGNARIVGFGESLHHIDEFTRMRSRLFRFLVKEMKFTTFVFECGVVEAKAAYDYVLGLHNDADAAFVPIESGFPVWRGFQDLVHWMRDYNSTARDECKIKFYGMDGSRRWMSTRTAVIFVCDYLAQVNPTYARTVREQLLPLAEAIGLENAGATSTTDVLNLLRGLIDLVGHLEIEQFDYIERSSFEAFDWAHRAALIARQIGSILSATHSDPENAQRYRWRIRDAGMATELKWILEREGPEARLLVGAHNIHLQKVIASGERTTAGQQLSLAMQPGELVIIAGTNYLSLKPNDSAIEGSFEAALAEVELPSFLLDLRSAKEDKRASAWLEQERLERIGIRFVPLHLALAFDAVYFTREISIDTLNLPSLFKRTFVDLEADQLRGLEGVYDIAGIGGNHVVLRIFRDSNRLMTDGAESDGELFPMPPSELFPMSDTHFAWREWPHEVEFERDASGTFYSLNLRAP